jgi:hypothetical protein
MSISVIKGIEGHEIIMMALSGIRENGLWGQ